MAYVSAKELRALVPDEYRDAALADQGEQPEPGLLAAVIDQASREVDALIEGRVRLPLSEPYPQKIITAAKYFALEILFTRRGVEMPKTTADKISRIRSDLGKVGAGDLRLEAPAEQTAESRASSGSIVVRPSITGSGGMIGAILLMLSCLAHSAQAVDSRTFDFVAPTNPLIESADYVEWSQAESVRLRYRLPSADATREARWEISDATNLWLNLAPTRSGSLWTWNPAPTQTCLPAGRYVGRVAVYERTGTNLTFHRILAFQDIRVHPARDPATLIMASPLASLGGSVTMGQLADAVAGLVTTASLAEAIEPLATTEQVAAAVSGKLDAAQAELLYQPAGNYQPAGSYLTDEADPEFLSWEPTANVPVVCTGGWLFPDYFAIRTYPYVDVGVSYGPTGEYNSILFTWQTVTPKKGEILAPEITHQQDWTSAVSFTNAEVLEIREDAGTTYADWPDGTASGTVGRVTAVLGEFSRTVELVYPGAAAAASNAWWVADLAGSFRAAVNAAVSNLAHASAKEAALFSPWPYTATNFLRNANCWAASLDLTCASPWNSNWKNYKAGTSITPQHFVYAEHFAAPTGTVFRWIDATNGIHDRTLVAQRFLGSDVALGLLDSPLPSSIAPAKTLAESDIGVVRGKNGLINYPGFRVVYLDAQERAWQAGSTFMQWVTTAYPEFCFATGSTNLPFSRYVAVGGDSGNPIFLTDGTDVILLSTFHVPQGGPFLPAFRSEIEAAMVEMGGSVHTNWPAADLSAWPNYDSGPNPADY